MSAVHLVLVHTPMDDSAPSVCVFATRKAAQAGAASLLGKIRKALSGEFIGYRIPEASQITADNWSEVLFQMKHASLICRAGLVMRVWEEPVLDAPKPLPVVIWKQEDTTKRHPRTKVTVMLLEEGVKRLHGWKEDTFQCAEALVMQYLDDHSALPRAAFERAATGGYMHVPHSLEDAGFARVYQL